MASICILTRPGFSRACLPVHIHFRTTRLYPISLQRQALSSLPAIVRVLPAPEQPAERHVQTTRNMDSLSKATGVFRLKLTLNLGLRYDYQSIAKPPIQNPNAALLAAGFDTSFQPKDKNNFGPRFGISYAFNDRTVIRGGYGIYYGRTPAT